MSAGVSDLSGLRVEKGVSPREQSASFTDEPPSPDLGTHRLTLRFRRGKARQGVDWILNSCFRFWIEDLRINQSGWCELSVSPRYAPRLKIQNESSKIARTNE